MRTRFFEPKRQAGRIALLIPLLILPARDPSGQDRRPEEPPPIESGLVERTEVSLMLLDVEVSDENGNPVRGLTEQDFRVRLDGRRWPILSVDDLCPCDDGSLVADSRSVARESGAAGNRETDGREAQSAVVETRHRVEPVKFIVYFDFSQLTVESRARAIEAATRWVRDTMRSGDEAMIAGYATRAGPKVLCEFTSDGERLLSAIDEASADVLLVDPFPTLREVRLDRCERCLRLFFPESSSCVIECVTDGSRSEWLHGQRSLEGLIRLLEALDLEPGRKELILFHENGTIFPDRLYPLGHSLEDEHVALVDRVGSEATLARTRIHTATLGDIGNRSGVNLGANLADFTGGTYNRGSGDLFDMLNEVGRGCSCTYRIGLEPPDGRKSRVYRAVVEAAGRAIDHRYRIRYLTEADRWWRRSRAVLADARRSTDIYLVAALVPVRASRGRWDVELRVGVDVDSLTGIPRGNRSQRDWEIGALLASERGHPLLEMLGVSRITSSDETGTLRPVVHERTFHDLKPGNYEGRAFVRDRVANIYGGGSVTIDLPHPRDGGLVGPLVLRADGEYVTASLPLLGKKERAAAPVTGGTTRGGVGFGTRPVVAGEPLELRTWVCAGIQESVAGEPQRYLSFEGQPVFRFETKAMEPAGDCATLVDRLDTSPMSPGAYTYHIRWHPAPGVPPRDGSVTFRVIHGAVGALDGGRSGPS